MQTGLIDAWPPLFERKPKDGESVVDIYQIYQYDSSIDLKRGSSERKENS